MVNKNRYYRRSRIAEKKFRQLIRCFVMDFTATDTAVLTGNYVENIPEPILSRMRVIHISQPSKSEMPFVIKSIYKKIRDDKTFGKVINPELDDEIINTLIELQPRQVRMTLEAAALKAIMGRRSIIHLSDVKYEKKERRHAIGFI